MSKQLDMAVLVFADHSKAIKADIIKIANDVLSTEDQINDFLEDGLWDPFFEVTGVAGDTYVRLLDEYGTEDDEVNFLICVWMNTLIEADFKKYQVIIDRFKFFLSEGL